MAFDAGWSLSSSRCEVTGDISPAAIDSAHRQQAEIPVSRIGSRTHPNHDAHQKRQVGPPGHHSPEHRGPELPEIVSRPGQPAPDHSRGCAHRRRSARRRHVLDIGVAGLGVASTQREH